MAAAVCTIGAAGLLAACGDDDSDSTESQQMTLVAPKIEIEATDLGEKDASRGDLRAFAQELYEEGTTDPVGRLDGSVQITDIDESADPPLEYRSGQIQFTLDEGTLVATGTYVAEPGVPVPAEGGVDRPIVGGTGAYEGAQGVVTATADGDGVRYDLDFETENDDD